jgi:hypothetical protein
MSNINYDSVHQQNEKQGASGQQQDIDPPPLTIQTCPLCQGSGTIICKKGKAEENVRPSNSSNKSSPPPPPLPPNSHTSKNDNATATTATTTAADGSVCLFPNPMQTEEKCNCCDGKGWVAEPQVANSRFCTIE